MREKEWILGAVISVIVVVGGISNFVFLTWSLVEGFPEDQVILVMFLEAAGFSLLIRMAGFLHRAIRRTE